MFIDRVVVIHIELHHRDDRCEFGNEGCQNTQFIHPPQGPFGVAVFQHQIKKDAARLFVLAHFVINLIKVCRNQAHGIWVQQGPCPQRLFKDTQDVQFIRKERCFVGDGQAVLLDRIGWLGLFAAFQ